MCGFRGKCILDREKARAQFLRWENAWHIRRSRKETCEGTVGRDKARGWGQIFVGGYVKRETLTQGFLGSDRTGDLSESFKMKSNIT